MTTLFSTQVPDTLPRSDRWRDSAPCREEDPELFFAVGDSPAAQQQTADAKAVCHRCPVMDTCLAWALDTRQDTGVWGGLSEKERHRLRRRRARNLPGPFPVAEPRTHRSVYEQHVRPIAGGHAALIRAITVVSVKGERFTLPQLAFYLHHGRRADGRVASYCGTTGCLTGAHLGDRLIRAARDAATAAQPDAADAARAWNNSGRDPAEYKPRKINPAQADEIRAQSLDGTPLQDLAQTYGVTTATIRNYAA